MKTSLRPATKDEKKRFEELKRLGCVACAHLGLWVIAPEIHHILRGGKRMSHTLTIPLCPGHHRGLWSMAQRLVIPKHKLVSIADGRKRLIQAYPSEREMWETVQQKLKLPTIWPESKVTHV